MYENATQNTIFKIIHSENEHHFKSYLLKNRSIRIKAQYKVGHHDQTMGHSHFTQKSFLYNTVRIYNKLPKNLTLIKEKHIFKKWIKKYNLDNNIKLKNQEDNDVIYEQQEIDEILGGIIYDKFKF